MNKVERDTIIKDAKALKINLTEAEIDLYVDEVNKFISLHPELQLGDVEPLRYVNEEVVNVFNSNDEAVVEVDLLLSNVEDREGNYIKVPKVL